MLYNDRKAAKVCDFGLAKAMDDTAGNTYGVGTLAWSAPETFYGKHARPPAID